MSPSNRKTWWHSDGALCLFLSCIIFLFFFRPHWAFGVNAVSDEGFYFARLESFFGQHFATGLGDDRGNNYFSIGAPLLWIPAGLMGHLLALIFPGGSDAWVWACVALLSFAFWGGSLFILVRLVKNWQLGDFPVALATLLSIPALYYSTHRVAMSHSAELLVSLATVYAVVKKKWVLSAILGVVLCLIRYNDLPILLFVSSAMLPSWSGKPALKWSMLISGAVLSAWVTWVGFGSGYGGVTIQSLWEISSFASLWSFLFGADWGAVWLIPGWVGALVLGTARIRSLSGPGRAAVLWLWLETVFRCAWGGNGSDFGQRYLIGSCVGALWIWAELLRGNKNGLRYFRYGAVASAVWMTYLTVFFKGVPGTGYQNNPEFLLLALQRVFDYRTYKVALAQSSLGSLWLSWFPTQNPFYSRLTVEGPGLWLLTASVALAIGYAVMFAASSRARPRKS